MSVLDPWKWEIARGPGEMPCHSMATPGFVLCRWWEGPGPGPWHKELADANLLSAAPDLLAALKGVVAVADRKTDEFYAAHAAIAKAEGRAYPLVAKSE